MTVVNVLPDPRHYSYATRTSNGKTLQPGQCSTELPISALHIEQLQKDLAGGKIQIRFTDEDRAFMARMLYEADSVIVVKSKPKPPAPVKRVKKINPKPTAHKPDFESGTPVAEEVKSGTPSLQDLMRQNRLGVPDFEQIGLGRGNAVTRGTPEFGKKSSFSEIQGHLGGIV